MVGKGFKQAFVQITNTNGQQEHEKLLKSLFIRESDQGNAQMRKGHGRRLHLGGEHTHTICR